MELIKRHTFSILAIALMIGLYVFLKPSPTIAPQPEKYTPESVLSDEDLIAYAKSDFDKKEMMHKEMLIGKHNDIGVRVTFPCADVCPDATLRIIRYDIDPQLSEMCEMIGGQVKSILVPMAITVMPQAFCFPNRIIESGVYEFTEKPS